jgi:hypothetical protein
VKRGHSPPKSPSARWRRSLTVGVPMPWTVSPDPAAANPHPAILHEEPPFPVTFCSPLNKRYPPYLHRSSATSGFRGVPDSAPVTLDSCRFVRAGGRSRGAERPRQRRRRRALDRRQVSTFPSWALSPEERPCPCRVTGRIDRCWDVVPACWREHSFIRSLIVLPQAAAGFRHLGREI